MRRIRKAEAHAFAVPGARQVPAESYTITMTNAAFPSPRDPPSRRALVEPPEGRSLGGPKRPRNEGCGCIFQESQASNQAGPDLDGAGGAARNLGSSRGWEAAPVAPADNPNVGGEAGPGGSTRTEDG